MGRLILFWKVFFGVLAMGLGLIKVLPAEEPHKDIRQQAIQVILLCDRSALMADHLEACADWLASAIVDGYLQLGDRARLWTFADKADLTADFKLTGSADIDSLKAAIRAIEAASVAPNYEAAAALLSQETNTIVESANQDDQAYAALLFVITTTLRFDLAAADKNEALFRDMIEYSRIIDHPGWKAVLVVDGIAEQIKVAVDFYMDQLTN